MRTLEKGPTPPILLARSAAWTASYERARQAGQKLPSPWRHDQIRRALSEETEMRCAYCDSRLYPVTKGHIEHVLPRVARPDLVVAWTNLTLACNDCNLAKGSYHDPDLHLINPYEDDVDAHLVFVGEVVWPVPGSNRGRETIKQLKLYRLELQEARKERIKYFAGLADVWSRTDGRARETMEDLIFEEWEKTEYQKSITSYLLAIGYPADRFGG